MSKAKKKQSRTYGIIIPSEWENAKAIIVKAKSVAKYYYYIEHDKDVFTENTDFGQIGEFKKKHIHLLFTFNSSRDLSTVCNYFSEFPELKENSFELINNAFGAKRYLVHADDPDKAQYNVLEVETNDKLFTNCFVEKLAADTEVKIIKENYKIKENETMDEYIDRHLPLLLHLNTYCKFIVIRGLRHDWYWQNQIKQINDNTKDKKNNPSKPEYIPGNENYHYNDNDGFPF